MKTDNRTLISFDWAIKRLLRKKADFAVLEAFLSVLLNRKVIVQNILESESNKDSAEDKQIIVDVLCQLDSKELVIIEVQFFHEVDYFQRILFGTSKMLVDHFTTKKPFQNVKKIYSVNLVYFDLGQGEDYVYHGYTEFKGINRGDTLQLGAPQKKRFQHELPKDLFPEYYIIKVNKFNDIAKSPLDEWIYYFKNSELPSKCDAKILSLLSENLKFDAMTVKEKKAYLKHRKNLLVSKSALETAYLEGLDKGEKKGMEKGMEKRDVEVIINSFKNGFKISQIAVITSMSEEKVEEILKSQGLL